MSTETKYPYCIPEVWGGIECTINRVGDVFRDQLHDAGHYTRQHDIDHFAALGITKLRYPVLWEKHQPGADGQVNWQWITRQLNAIRNKNIAPIAGLLHHGSGPQGTHLLDKNFPAKLAAYAGSVAKQFPWLEYYTPVNEPLTTARFSGLYGFWFPHHKKAASFARMLLNQVKATILSMQAIRAVNRHAKLVQTEDLSKTHSTPKLAYQASFENKRRWLTYDLLCGKVNKQHYFWKYFVSLGITQKELNFFIQNACPPDIIGFNYYVTSERYLDEKLHQYAQHAHGSNGKHRYADVEAVRTGHMAGLECLLEEAWNRYRLPMAVTECHLHCTREEQLRWLKEVWEACCNANKKGVCVKAVTAWSLLGSYDWDSLLLQHRRHYEAGVFDTRNGSPRPTLLAKMIRSLADKKDFSHPLIHIKGWWARKEKEFHAKQTAPLVIIGKSSVMGKACIKMCRHRAIRQVALPANDPRLANEAGIRQLIEHYKPWGIVNAAYEMEAGIYGPGNAMPHRLLAAACYNRNIQLMVFSSEFFFPASKKNCFARSISMAEEEQAILAINPRALLVRTGSFSGTWDTFMPDDSLATKPADARRTTKNSNGMLHSSAAAALAESALDFFIDEEKGTWYMNRDGILVKTGNGNHLQRAAFSKRARGVKSIAEEPAPYGVH